VSHLFGFSTMLLPSPQPMPINYRLSPMKLPDRGEKARKLFRGFGWTEKEFTPRRI